MSETEVSTINRRSTSRRKSLRSKSKSRPVSEKKYQATRNAFFNFLRDFRRQNQGLKVTELTKRGAQTWRQMNTGDKSHYWQLARDTQKDCSSCRKGRKGRKRRRSRHRRHNATDDAGGSQVDNVKDSQRTLTSHSSHTSRTSHSSRKTVASGKSVPKDMENKKSLIYFTNPFLNFIRDYNLKNPRANKEPQKDRLKMIGEVWRKMNISEKQQYKDIPSS